MLKASADGSWAVRGVGCRSRHEVGEGKRGLTYKERIAHCVNGELKGSGKEWVNAERRMTWISIPTGSVTLVACRALVAMAPTGSSTIGTCFAFSIFGSPEESRQ